MKFPGSGAMAVALRRWLFSSKGRALPLFSLPGIIALAQATKLLFTGLRTLLSLTLLGALSTSYAQWMGQDIGTVASAGSASSDSGTIVIRGSGADIWGAGDAFQFYSRPIAGDVSLTARITGMTDTNGWAKAGVMIRESLQPNAANVFIAVTPEWHGIVTQQRGSTGSETTSADAAASNSPYWLRLTRSGNTIAASISPDGLTWTPAGSFTLTIASSAYVGLAVTSHNDGTLCTATFDNLTATTPDTYAPPPSAPVGLTAATVSSSQIALSWTNTSNVQNQIAIERSTDGTSFQQIAVIAGTSTSYTDSDLNSSTNYSYWIRGINNAGYGPHSNVASATTSAPPPLSDGWLSRDIGTNTAGQTTASDSAVTLSGSGRDIWNETDGFRYYYHPMTIGDAEIIVRVASVSNANGWSKAGIMLRESLDPGSAQAWICVSAEHGTAFQWRATTNGETQSSAPSEDGPAPRWLKLVFKEAGTEVPIPRRVFSYVSQDGVNWTAVQTTYLNNTWNYIGLAVTSHNDGALSTAQFDHFRYLTPPPAPTGLQVANRGPNGYLRLTWTSGVNDVDRFEIQSNPQRAGNHDWTTIGTAAGSARQGEVNIGDGAFKEVQIIAYRDLVQSPFGKFGYIQATVTPQLSVVSSSSSGITLRMSEVSTLQGPQGGPWSLERSSDGFNFVEIAGGLRPTNDPYNTDYTDTTVPPGETRQYRARQLLSNGDRSGYSAIVTGRAAAPNGPPAAPSNLTAAAQSPTSVRLTWTDNATDEDEYEIGRSTDNVTYFGLGHFPANLTSYTDTTASPGTFYYYKVLAFKNGVGAQSNIATVTTPSAPTGSSWSAQDIGSPATPGSASSSGDSITVSGAGSDIWGGSDSFRFAYQSVTGAVTLTARVVSMTNTNGWAKAGLMIRDSTAAGARNMLVAVTPDFHGIVAQHRDDTGGTTAQVNGPAVTPPYWLRLSRNSDYIQMFTSPDGVTWTEFFTWPSSLISPTALVGFAVTSHNDGTVCSASFDHVSLAASSSPPTGSVPNAPTSLTAGVVSQTQLQLDWTDNSSNETEFQLERAASNSGPFTLIATAPANTTRLYDGGLTPATTYYYRVRARNGAGASTYGKVASGTTAATVIWTSADIGNVGRTGSDSATGSTITVNGSGADIWGNADAFHFVYRSWSGDGVVQARVASMTDTNGWAKAGVMIRENLDGGATNVFVALTPSWHGIVAQARSNMGGVTTQTAGPAKDAPYWVRIARSGNTFTASTSSDGVSWTNFATFNVNISVTAFFGFAVTSHDTSQLNQAVFQEPYVGAP